MKNIGFMTGIALAIFLTSACADKKATEREEKVIPVKVMSVALSTMTAERNYVGTIEESSGVSLSFSNAGTVEQVFVSEGQTVTKGRLLASLNPSTAQNSVDAARASLRQAQDAYDRLSKLHDNGSIPDIKFVEVETGLQQSRSMLAVAEKNLDDCRLYAPRSGVIAQRYIEPGANVMPGASAFKLVMVDRVTANFFVPENEIGSTRIGQKTLIEVAALGNEQFEGNVEMKGVSANPLSHSYEVKTGIDNPQAKLMPGMVCKVRIVQDGSEAEIVVPNRSVQIAPDGRTFVWIADGAVAKRRFVRTGNLADNGIAVREGLQSGDRIIVEGYPKISEGMKISIITDKLNDGSEQ
ncbi:MAG: efflux RND transporter periplasmic adaptor subunit [Tannerellaceae bacterium]|jgi:RND family efflux transporter MFP subunit|nr:efflux RND transporter periplasmic adaptor subunit [Tannerellaceae bacterium]